MREESKIKRHKVDWRQYEAPKLDIRKRKMYSIGSYMSCGSAALGLVTGISAKTVEKSCPNPKVGWHTGTAIRYLKSKGYTVIEISKEDLLKSHWHDFPINDNHCLLMNIRMDGQENSMFVLHKGNIWHNYACEDYFDNLFFINKPTQDVLLVSHENWK